MAETPVTLYPDPDIAIRRVAWLAVPNGNTGEAVAMGEYADRSVQVTGTFGTGGSVSLQGSNDDGATWVTLTDPAGSAVTFTGAGLKQVLQSTQKLRCSVTAGDGSTALNVYVFMKKDRS